jgi:hypothetical protein
MKFIDFAFKLFGYQKRLVVTGSKDSVLAGTEKPVKKYIKVHPPIFGLVFFNALNMFSDWYRTKLLGLKFSIGKTAAEFAVKNPLYKNANIGYIEVPEQKKE